MVQQPQDTIVTLLYRMTAIEAEFARFKEQLKDYDTTRENDLKLQRINDTASRIEADLRAVKTTVEEMNKSMLVKEEESKTRDTRTSDAQSTLQIKVLVFILSTILTIVIALFIFYITHLH